MSSQGDHRSVLFATVLGGGIAAASLEPIRNYDYFWHLATGRWIVEHRALPASDPFTLASHDGPWINLEWMFQVLLYPSYQLLGHRGLTVVLALAAGLGTALLFLYLSRRTTAGVALLLSTIGWFGAAHRLELRPETAAIPLLVIALALLLRPPRRASIPLLFALTVMWFAVHPSALLSPVLAGLVLAGSLFDAERSDRWLRLGQMAAAGLALLVNPWFIEGVLAPVRLASMLDREGLVNLEWLPTDPRVFPELYALIAVSMLVLIVRRRGEYRWSRALVFAFLGLLAARYVRNHAFFYPALPILLAPSIGVIDRKWDRIVIGGAIVVWISGLLGQNPGFGVDASRFPVRVIARLESSGLRGHVYTPDQLGGYLVWSFYPERRALLDGRNELYVEFLRRFEAARKNSRDWVRLLEDYDLTLAVEEYRDDEVQMIDGETGAVSYVPPSTVYFPHERWALIGFDESAMLFARREAHSERMLRELELRSIVPDAIDPEDAVRGNDVDTALEDLLRLKREAGSFPRLEKLGGWLARMRMENRSGDRGSGNGDRGSGNREQGSGIGGQGSGSVDESVALE